MGSSENQPEKLVGNLARIGPRIDRVLKWTGHMGFGTAAVPRKEWYSERPTYFLLQPLYDDRRADRWNAFG
jgi:hypothetical protein